MVQGTQAFYRAPSSAEKKETEFSVLCLSALDICCNIAALKISVTNHTRPHAYAGQETSQYFLKE